MALVLADRVRETTAITGTGTATLLGAVSGYQSFSAVGNANTTYYVIANQSASEWEVGIGTYTASGTTLSRDTVLSSSNSGSLVNFSAGTKDVFVDYPAGRAVYEDAAGNVDGYPITGGTINNTVIGGTTPAAGTFTTLTATGQTSLGGASGSESLVVLTPAATGSALQVQAGATYTELKSSGTATNATLRLISKGTGSINFSTNNTQGTIQASVSHTASAVNYVQVTGAATGGAPTVISSQGSDAAVNLRLSAKGSSTLDAQVNSTTRWKINADGSVDSGISASGGISFKASATGSQVNYLQSAGAVVGSSPILSSQGSDTNIDLNLTTKGTGAVNLNTGGGTQFSVANTASATNYFATTGSNGGTPALYSAGASTNIGANFVSKGTGALAFYTNGSLAQFVVTNTASAVNYVQVTGAATGGTPTISAQGSDATANLSIASKGSGIVFIGGQSSASSSTVRLSPSGGNAFFASGTNASVNYLMASGASTGNSPLLIARGTDTNVGVRIGALNAGNVDLLASGDPNAGTGALQLRVAPTASAVNYVQVTGAATGSSPNISSQGSDTNLGLQLRSKGTGAINLMTQGGLNQAVVFNNGNGHNFLGFRGGNTGVAPIVSAEGSDTNIDLALTPKGTGNVRFGTYTGTILTPTGYVEIKDSGGTVRRLLVG